MTKSIVDLMKLTGKGRETIVKAVAVGECPGYFLDGKFSCPDDAFELFSLGYWQPQPARREQIQPSHPLVKRVGRTSSGGESEDDEPETATLPDQRRKQKTQHE